MWVTFQTYAMGALSLGISGKLLWHQEIGLNMPTFLIGGFTAATLYLLINTKRFNGAS